MTIRGIIGVSAPPSLAGTDAVLLELEGEAPELSFQVVQHLTEPHAKDLREFLVRVSTPEQADVRQISLANQILGEAFAATVRRLADRASVSLQSVLCVGCGGFSAWHDGLGRIPSAMSLGAAAVIAERTGLSVVDDFAGRDLACGGQGVPLSAIVDAVKFQALDEDRLVVHLGGITQLTVLPARNTRQPIQAWQAGPGNVLLDSLIQVLTNGKERWDSGGKHAVQGRQIPELLERWLHHPFLIRKPPKSIHRSQFAEAFARQVSVLAQQQGWEQNDLLCTATHLVARCIAESFRRFAPRGFSPRRAILSGGGVRNGLLWRLIEEQLQGLPLERSDGHGVPAETREAVDAAVLAGFFVDGGPASLPGVTGATGSRLLGRITPGSQANWSRCLAWLSGDRRLFEDDE
jgi:anhydro-N-acetylmuramic acid kinase